MMKKTEKEKIKRVNITIPESYYNEIVKKRKWKLSGTIREALEDSLSQDKIILSVSKETKELYHQIFNKSHYSDQEIEVYFRKALKSLLDDFIDETNKDLIELRKKLE